MVTRKEVLQLRLGGEKSVAAGKLAEHLDVGKDMLRQVALSWVAAVEILLSFPNADAANDVISLATIFGNGENEGENTRRGPERRPAILASVEQTLQKGTRQRTGIADFQLVRQPEKIARHNRIVTAADFADQRTPLMRQHGFDRRPESGFVEHLLQHLETGSSRQYHFVGPRCSDYLKLALVKLFVRRVGLALFRMNQIRIHHARHARKPVDRFGIITDSAVGAVHRVPLGNVRARLGTKHHDQLFLHAHG